MVGWESSSKGKSPVRALDPGERCFRDSRWRRHPVPFVCEQALVAYPPTDTAISPPTRAWTFILPQSAF
eukprot:459623-Pleurochrysis_carterae.AAC.1